ncbi:tRNA-dependent cyclodipeptide synthase [Pseudomonas sp. CFBP 8770]|uniref:tRNA-dependent cyclodipeptide synthase n=1 Tax=unclassified Pseudomonas TaxID=196821 RepID=UPI00177E4F0F|nr:MULTISPECIES: tRNA-dependent cyclodipeptide synthase [unclassified Pseudomonas]MBD8475873.1 tRNA-dependent cyclodipeptide synthase [Pseudomonas sp. CFBP 8773]MBD8648744.1 tRNA-dependent cyclodipeptide synthase [Pseudomonas sp. CFBP 8770]
MDDTYMVESGGTPKYKLSVEGYSPHCSKTLQYRDHALIGISPFNSRFSPDYVDELLSWAHREFKRVDILLPDNAHAGLLLRATGIPAEKADRKVRKELNRHTRTIKRVLEKLDGTSANTNIFRFSDFFDHPEYRRLRSQVETAYGECSAFRAACKDMSSQAISGRARGTASGSQNLAEPHKYIDIAIPYIFAELPFYLNSPRLTLASSSTFLYHKIWPIGIALREGQFPLEIDEKQAHGIVSIN